MEIFQEFTFDAAHRFPGVPEGHPYHGLHGHSFVACVVLSGKGDPKTGFIADLAEARQRCRGLRERLDHKYLNDVHGLERRRLDTTPLPTSNNLNPVPPPLPPLPYRP